MGDASDLAVRIAMRGALSLEQAEVQREELRLELGRALGQEIPRRAGSFWLEELVDELLELVPEHADLFGRLASILRSTHVVLRPIEPSLEVYVLADEIAASCRVAVRIARPPVASSGADLLVSVPDKLRSQAPAIQSHCEERISLQLGRRATARVE